MELLGDVTVSALALAINLGIPVAVLFLIGYATYRADHPGQWLAGTRYSMAGLVALGNSGEAQSLGPVQPGCLEDRDCGAERMSDCSALANPGTPCWQAAKRSLGHLRLDCLDCDRFVGLPGAGQSGVVLVPGVIGSGSLAVEVKADLDSRYGRR